MIIKKFEAWEPGDPKTFDQSKDDFEIGKKSILMLLDQLIEEYDDFTKDVSPKNWRTTSHHFHLLNEMKEQITSFEPISVQQKITTGRIA